MTCTRRLLNRKVLIFIFTTINSLKQSSVLMFWLRTLYVQATTADNINVTVLSKLRVFLQKIDLVLIFSNTGAFLLLVITSVKVANES
jgi:hypothetical protein